MDKARRIAVLGMVVSALLAILKITVGWLAHSASVSADGMESAADVFASGFVLIGLTLSARPADSNHPYGHGRAETLTGLLLGFLLFDAGCLIAWHGLTGAEDVRTVPHAYAIWPLIVSVVAKLWLMLVKLRHGRAIGSSSLLADATNDAIDMLSGAVALGALSLTLHDPAKFPRADHYGAFCVGLIVIATAFRIMHDASLLLMDTMPDDKTIRAIRSVALQVPNVLDVEKCFARKTGLKYHVDLHVEVQPEITVRESHDIAHGVREHLLQELPWIADVLVHVEPWQQTQSRAPVRL
jgi:cation diffusion facilitator family transporter